MSDSREWLTEKEIDGKILEGHVALKDELMQKIDETHDEQNKRIDKVSEQTTALVGTENIQGLVPRLMEAQTATLAEVKRGNELTRQSTAQMSEWHDGDLQFRESTEVRFTQLDRKVEDNHRQVTDRLDVISWFITTCNLFMKIGTGVNRGRDVWKVVAAFLAAWVAVVQAVHSGSMPFIDHWSRQHPKIVTGFALVLVGLAVVAGLRKRAPAAAGSED